MSGADFPEKLRLLLKVLMVSRTGLASTLNVDKSLVGRWASGAVTPSNHNLAKLTRFVAQHVRGFTVLDWERDMHAFNALLGVGGNDHTDPRQPWIPPSIMVEAQLRSGQRGEHYAGLWRSTRASHDLPGRFIHDLTLIRLDGDGVVRFSVGVEGVRYRGWSLMLQNQLFSVSFDEDAGNVLFSIYNGVARQRPQVLDGLNLATLRDAGGSPAASRSILERVAELTGDADHDEAMFEAAIADLNPLAPEGSVDPVIAEHLTKGVTGDAEGILRVLYSQTLSRGSTLGEIAAASGGR